jgi:hypothetical protein
MKTSRRFAASFLAVSLIGLVSACKTTPKAEAKKEIEGVDYILVHETGSLVPRKVRTKTDALTSHMRNGSLSEFEKASGDGSRAPSENPPNRPTLQNIPGTR